MSKLIYIFASLLSFIVIEETGAVGKKSWTYELISVNGKSADENLFKSDLKVEIVSRGEYVLTGTIALNFEATDDTQFEIQSFSSSDDNNYKKLPFAVQKKPLTEFFNKEYKDMVMESLSSCSNLPYFENAFEPPLGPITFELNKCALSTEKLPQHVPEGYYKVILLGSGQVDWSIELLAKLETVKF